MTKWLLDWFNFTVNNWMNDWMTSWLTAWRLDWVHVLLNDGMIVWLDYLTWVTEWLTSWLDLACLGLHDGKNDQPTCCPTDCMNDCLFDWLTGLLLRCLVIVWLSVFLINWPADWFIRSFCFLFPICFQMEHRPERPLINGQRLPVSHSSSSCSYWIFYPPLATPFHKFLLHRLFLLILYPNSSGRNSMSYSNSDSPCFRLIFIFFFHTLILLFLLLLLFPRLYMSNCPPTPAPHLLFLFLLIHLLFRPPLHFLSSTQFISSSSSSPSHLPPRASSSLSSSAGVPQIRLSYHACMSWLSFPLRISSKLSWSTAA